MTGGHSFLYGSLILAGFAGLAWLMWRDIVRVCERALHEAELDAWDEAEADELEVAA